MAELLLLGLSWWAAKHCVRLVGTVQKLARANTPVPESGARFSARGSDGATVKDAEGVIEIVLEEVQPDEGGLIEIDGEREDGCILNFSFFHLEATETHGRS